MAMNPVVMAAAIRQMAQGFGPHINWLNKPIPAMGNILEGVFNLAHSEWAREFLFFPNPHVDAGVLTSPLNLQYKVAGQINQDVKTERVGPYTANSLIGYDGDGIAPDSQFYSDWVIVPAFNFGQMGACYFMQKTNMGPAEDKNSAIRSALYRMVTDDVTGEVLYVGEMPETDTFQVIHMMHINGAYHQRSMCIFEGSVLRAALRADNGRISIPHVVKALVLYYLTRETRMCMVCGAHPSLCCNCPVSLRQAEHPHDLRFYAHNTRTHLGEFSGKQIVMYWRKGSVLKTGTEYTLHRVNTNITLNTALSLRQWAVRDRLGAAVQHAFGRYIQRPPISTAAVTAALLNMGKSFDEVVDVLAESDNPHLVAHRHYTRSFLGTYSLPVSTLRSGGTALGNLQGSPYVTEGDEMVNSQSVLAEYNVNGPAAGVTLEGNHHERSLQIQQLRVAHHTRNRAEEVRLADQLAMEQQRIDLEGQMELSRTLEKRRRAMQKQQLLEQQQLLQQRDLLQRQHEQAHRQPLADNQRRKAAAIERQAVQYDGLAQRQAFERTDSIREQGITEQQLELYQMRQKSGQQRDGHVQDARIMTSAPVQSIAENSSVVGEALTQAFTESARRSLPSSAVGVEQRHSNPLLSGNGSQWTASSQRALSHETLNASNLVSFEEGLRSDHRSSTHSVHSVPRALLADRIGAPLETLHAAGISHPQEVMTASSGAGKRAQNGTHRTEAGQWAANGGAGVVTGGWHNGNAVRRAVNVRIGHPALHRPAPVERRLLPRGPQPASQVSEDPEKKRELNMRIRKREAARRSDAKRLAKVQQMQAEKKNLEGKADELRTKRAQLLDENALLKRRVAALGTWAPSLDGASVHLR